MASSIETSQSRLTQQQAVAARALIQRNLKKLEDADALAITDAFRTLQYELDDIPMTREQREEIDLKISILGVLLNPQ